MMVCTPPPHVKPAERLCISRQPEPIGSPRHRTGRFARPSDPRALTPVVLPNGRTGYRVGEDGRIYANRHHAVAAAIGAENRMVRIGGLR